MMSESRTPKRFAIRLMLRISLSPSRIDTPVFVIDHRASLNAICRTRRAEIVGEECVVRMHLHYEFHIKGHAWSSAWQGSGIHLCHEKKGCSDVFGHQYRDYLRAAGEAAAAGVSVQESIPRHRARIVS